MASKPATTAKRIAAPEAAAKAPGKQPAAAAARAVPPKKAAAARAAAPKKVVATVTLKTLFEQLADAHAMPVKQAQSMAAGMVDLVTAHLKKGDRVRISGLGIMEVKDRSARMGRNPATGAPMQIAASRKVAFRTDKELKDAL